MNSGAAGLGLALPLDPRLPKLPLSWSAGSAAPTSPSLHFTYLSIYLSIYLSVQLQLELLNIPASTKDYLYPPALFNTPHVNLNYCIHEMLAPTALLRQSSSAESLPLTLDIPHPTACQPTRPCDDALTAGHLSCDSTTPMSIQKR